VVRHLSGRWLSGGGDGFVRAEGRLTEDNMAGLAPCGTTPGMASAWKESPGEWALVRIDKEADGWAREGNSFQNFYNYDFISWHRINSYDDLKNLGKSYG
jgi:hypothetical protein